MILVTPRCPICNEASQIEVDAFSVMRWSVFGELIQNAFPDLSPDDRELIQTGTHPECWNTLFGEED